MFSETNYKKQAHILFLLYHSLPLHYSSDILQFNLKKSLDLDLKKLGLFTGLGLTLWCIGLGLEKHSNYLDALGLILGYIEFGLQKCLDYLTGVRLILWYIWLGLKKHLDYLSGVALILLYIGLGLIKWSNQAEMPLEKYKDFLELSVKQLVIQSSPIFLGQ